MWKIYLHVSTALAYDAIINKHKKKAFNILLSILFIYLFIFLYFARSHFFFCITEKTLFYYKIFRIVHALS